MSAHRLERDAVRRLNLAGAITLICVSLSGLVVISMPTAAHAADAPSAATATGTGEFSNLQVTVSQTDNLTNQVVKVSWSGGTPTSPDVGGFNTDFMQVMQCWGDGPAPVREDCQFGGYSGDTRGGDWVASRQVTYGKTLKDPSETIVQPAGSRDNLLVPFNTVGGDSTTQFPNPYFDQNTTNEEPFGRTAADGTGAVYFEVQTAQQSPGLGCGAKQANGQPRDCWLVVVPRSRTEVDGSAQGQLRSSPLSASNFANAIAVRLHFQPLAVDCPIGVHEKRLIGQETVGEAVTRWQPELCAQTGSTFGYSQVGDGIGRAQAIQADPWLSFVSAPVPASANPDGRTLAYAPVALSGIGIAFNIDLNAKYGAPPAARALSGHRLDQLKLTPRLVAKLLTQSYTEASFVPKLGPKNAQDLTSDPEFRTLNPQLNDMFFNGVYEIVIPEGLADAYRELWAWIASDPAARDFIAGKPDPWGETINRAYQGMSPDRNDFPRSDLACAKVADQADQCNFDLNAYAADMHDASRAAARGDLLARTLWDPSATPPVYKKRPLQLSGSRAILSLTDSATAARYSLPMASLQNPSGAFVAPTASSLLQGEAAMSPSAVDSRVLMPNPRATSSDAYPLAHLTYALTAPGHLTKDEQSAYSKFLTYAAGPGQIPGIAVGQLPAGYVPLPQQLTAQTMRVAADLTSAPAPSASPSPSTSASPAPPASVSPSPTTTSGPAAVSPPVPATLPQGAPSITTARHHMASTPLNRVSYVTPANPLGASRFVVLLALIGALGLGFLWLALPLMARRGPPAP